MTVTMLWILSILGVVVSIGLMVKIARQIRFLDKHKEQIAALREKESQRDQKLRESILILCSSMIDEQVEISEGCMRVKILLDHLDARLHHDEVLGVFNRVYERLEKMPRFEERKQIDRRLLYKLDETRYQVEDQYKEAVLSASRLLIERLS